ncbi:hypothetical protein [Modestobacter italicus]|uniref:hypothetical protein n=1 Tax=Modestobacter italicus (strain DSM 44449 / CECT 9708 / BC 501) TaxID=2732864 RepID=UPI001C94263A|nr:hypothetical protein [Modestobacter italicus]
MVRSTETGHLRTTTRRADSAPGFVLHRAAGPLRQHELQLPAELAARVAGLPVDGLVWSPGRPAGDGLEHAVPGEASVATLVLAGMPLPAVARMVAPVGAALAAVHALPATSGAAPSGLRRLEAWLHTGQGPGDAARLHALLADVPGLTARLRDWVDDLRTAPARLALGAPGMNTLYPDPAGDRTAVLVTDELADAAPEWDLGWLLGELLELANDPHRTAAPVPLEGHPVAEVVLAGHRGADRQGPGAALDRGRLSRAAVLRWVVHLHDYVAYVDWAEDLPARLQRVGLLAADPDRLLARW